MNNFSYLELQSQVTIGRTTGELVFADDGRLSGKHAQVSVEDGAVYVEDLGSKNRTAVNRIEIPPSQKIKLKNFALIEVGAQQFIVTDSKSLSIQQLNEVMEHHMQKAVVKLDNTAAERTKTGFKSTVLPKEYQNQAVDPIVAKENLLMQLQKDIVTLEQNAKSELAKLEEQKEKIITQAKNKRAELMAKAQALKAEVEKEKAEAQKLKAEMEQKKKKIINLNEISTEELPE